MMKAAGSFNGTAGSGGRAYRSKFPNDERFASQRSAAGVEHGFGLILVSSFEKTG